MKVSYLTSARTVPVFRDDQDQEWVFIKNQVWRSEPYLAAWSESPTRRQEGGIYIQITNWRSFVTEDGSPRS